MTSQGRGTRARRQHLLDKPEHALQRYRLALRIKGKREAIGLTQDQLATLLGVSQGRVAHWETGRGAPHVVEVPMVCRVLGTDPNTLLLGDDPAEDADTYGPAP